MHIAGIFPVLFKGGFLLSIENKGIDNFQALKEEVRGFLKAHKLATISTVSPEGIPVAAIVMFFFDEEFNFYFITRRSTRKFNNLQANKNVAFVVGTELAPGTVQANGIAEFLPDEGLDFVDKIGMGTEMHDLYYGPFLQLAGKDFAVFKVKINWLRYLHLDLATGKENYYQIIP